jgi:hypothetical protein
MNDRGHALRTMWLYVDLPADERRRYRRSVLHVPWLLMLSLVLGLLHWWASTSLTGSQSQAIEMVLLGGALGFCWIAFAEFTCVRRFEAKYGLPKYSRRLARKLVQ